MRLYEKMQNGVYIIAEMSANHGGNLDNALKIAEEAKAAGADCLKLQTYTADTLTINCSDELFKIKGGLWDGYTYYELYKEASTPWEWHRAIKDKCVELGLDFLSTPFDKTSVDFLEELGIEFYKIASFELVDIPLIEYAASKGKPMVMSCGMASIEEIEEAVQACRSQGNNQIVLLKCCSQYPAAFEDMKLALIQDMKERFQLPVGLSDHSEGSLAPVMAVALGAKVIEKHVCLNKEIESPDMGFSMTMPEFRKMVTDVRNACTILGSPSYELTDSEKRQLKSRRSLFAVRDIAEGEGFTPENMKSIRPSDGVKPKYYDELIGKKAKYTYKFGEPIRQDECGR